MDKFAKINPRENVLFQVKFMSKERMVLFPKFSYTLHAHRGRMTLEQALFLRRAIMMCPASRHFNFIYNCILIIYLP